MNRIVACVILIISSYLSHAQTTKGSFVLGGDATLSFRKNEVPGIGTTKSNSLNLNPSVGYFIRNNFAAGLTFPVTTSHFNTSYSNGTPSSESSASSYAVGPFVRYYIPLGKIFILTEGSYTWVRNQTKYPQIDFNTGVRADVTSTTKDKNYRVATGLAVFLGENAGIDILLNYQKFKFDSQTSSNLFLSVGFKVYIPSKK